MEYVFDHFCRYHMKILLGDFNAKFRKKGRFEPTTGSDRSHEIGNDNGMMWSQGSSVSIVTRLS
jgi:hypothetical protein